jgi:hypothetical protein
LLHECTDGRSKTSALRMTCYSCVSLLVVRVLASLSAYCCCLLLPVCMQGMQGTGQARAHSGTAVGSADNHSHAGSQYLSMVCLQASSPRPRAVAAACAVVVSYHLSRRPAFQATGKAMKTMLVYLSSLTHNSGCRACCCSLVLSMAFTCTGSAAAPATPSLLGCVLHGNAMSESR